MIHAYMHSELLRTKPTDLWHELVDRIIADGLPAKGDTIYVRYFGKAVVVSLYHNDLDNYIMLTWLETDLAEHTTTERFRVDA